MPLRDENISRVLGACLEVEPLLLVMEYSEHGDLYQFLQNYVAESASLSTNANVLRYRFIFKNILLFNYLILTQLNKYSVSVSRYYEIRTIFNRIHPYFQARF